MAKRRMLWPGLLAAALSASGARADEAPAPRSDDTTAASDDDTAPPRDDEAAPPRDEEAPPPRVPHPEPRVIVRVLKLDGPHERGDVERAARLGWGRIVRCYKAQRKRVRGSVTLNAAIEGKGSVGKTRLTRTTLEDRNLARCLTKTMKGLAMPRASRRSHARIEIWVGPGDAS